jgi:hypothetical protein
MIQAIPTTYSILQRRIVRDFNPHAILCSFVGLTPGCWIGGSQTVDQLVGQYVWFWVAAFADVFLYVPLYFCLRKYIGPFSLPPEDDLTSIL